MPGASMNQQPSIRRTDLHRVWIAPHTPADEDRRVQGDAPRPRSHLRAACRLAIARRPLRLGPPFGWRFSPIWSIRSADFAAIRWKMLLSCCSTTSIRLQTKQRRPSLQPEPAAPSPRGRFSFRRVRRALGTLICVSATESPNFEVLIHISIFQTAPRLFSSLPLLLPRRAL